MDSTLIAYSISFAAVLAVLYWKMRQQILDLLAEKQKDIQEVMKTAEYINNVSMTALYKEADKNTKIEEDVAQIKIATDKKIANLLNTHKTFQMNLQRQLEKELDEHIQQINGQFTQDMREEISDLIVMRLQQKLTTNGSKKTPAQQFVQRMQARQCV